MRDRGSHHLNTVQHRVIFSVSFAIHVMAGWLRLLPVSRRGSHKRSMIAEAWAASDTIARLAFAG